MLSSPIATAVNVAEDGNLPQSTRLRSFERAIDHLAIVATTDRAGVITGANDRFCETSKYAREELIGRKHNVLNSGYHPRSFFVDMWRTIGSGRAWRGEICNRAKDGSRYWVDTTIVPHLDDRGRSVGYVSIRYDITKRKLAEAEIIAENQKREKAERLLREIIDAVPSGVVAFDENDRLALFNAAYRELYPSLQDQLTAGTPFEDLVRRAVERNQIAVGRFDASDREGWVQARLNLRRTPGRKFIQHLSDGRWLQIQERYSQSGYTVSVQTDITGLKRAERRIKEQAERDPLTGLYNRRVLLERLASALSGRHESRRAGAVILIDLDGFKITNDTLGHDAGDLLLKEIAHRLTRAMRKVDVVARLGGDEFAVLAYGVAPGTDSEKIARKLLHVIEEPMKLGGKQVVPSASLGIACYPSSGTTPAELMQFADLALYEAKERGRRTYVSFRPAMRRRVERRGAMARDLRESIRRQSVEVALQPQLGLRDGQHAGFEALVRWRRRGRMVPPQEMIHVAESTGLISELGALVATRCLSVMHELGQLGVSAGSIALNVAADQLRDPAFVHWLCELIDEHGFQRKTVEIEVTEKVVLDRESDSIVSNLRDLHQCGVRIALDDFGTGYASLSHLTQFPIDGIKIDRSFVHGLEADSQRRVIAKSVVALAHDLGMDVVAEGVETRQQLCVLKEMGCDFVQGFLIAKPLDPSQVVPYLTASGRERAPLADRVSDKYAARERREHPAD